MCHEWPADGVAVRGDNPLAVAHVGKFYSLYEQSERFKLGDKPNTEIRQ